MIVTTISALVGIGTIGFLWHSNRKLKRKLVDVMAESLAARLPITSRVPLRAPRETVLINVEHSTCEPIALYSVSRHMPFSKYPSPWAHIGHALNAETAIKHGTRIDIVQGWIDRTTGTIFLGNRMPPIVPLV